MLKKLLERWWFSGGGTKESLSGNRYPCTEFDGMVKIQAMRGKRDQPEGRYIDPNSTF